MLEGVRHELTDMAVSPHEVIVTRIHQEQADVGLAKTDRVSRQVRDHLGRPGGDVLEYVDSYTPELLRGEQDVLRFREIRSGEELFGPKHIARHPIDPELVKVPDQDRQRFLFLGLRRFHYVRSGSCNRVPAAVPLNGWQDLAMVFVSGTKDRVDERDRQVGGEECIREFQILQGNRVPDHSDDLVDLRFDYVHLSLPYSRVAVTSRFQSIGFTVGSMVSTSTAFATTAV